MAFRIGFRVWIRSSSKKTTSSSHQWLARQKKDEFVKLAKQEGYSSRASFKIIQILEKVPIMKEKSPSKVHIIDLGAAPGSWSQALSRHFSATQPRPFRIIAVDKNTLDTEINGVNFVQGDFTTESVKAGIEKLLEENKVNMVLSDMAPPASGDKQLDHARLVNLSEEALQFAVKWLSPKEGIFVCKLSHGIHEMEFCKQLSAHFQSVKLIKPSASRKDSNEIFYLNQQLKTQHIANTLPKN